MPTLVPVVEGFGDVQAVPVLIRRVLMEIVGRYDVTVGAAVRRPGPPLLTPEGMLRAVHNALARPRCDAILVLRDDEDGCPKIDGPVFLKTLRQALVAASVPMLPASAVLTYREYETWFIAGLGSPGFVSFVKPQCVPPLNPEARRDAKGWLEDFLKSGTYIETIDQVLLTARLDLNQTRSRSDSFDKLCREILGIASALP